MTAKKPDIRIGVSPKDHERIKKEAKRIGLIPSSLLRMTLFKYLNENEVK